MPVIAALIALFMLGVAYAVFLLFWAIGVLLLPIRNKLIYIALSLPVFAVVSFGLYTYSTRPSVLFRQSFGFTAPNSVRFIHSSTWYLGDWGSTYLRFVADEPVILRIVTVRKISRLEDRSVLHVNDEPNWWKPQFGANIDVYGGEFSNRDFGSEDDILYYNRDTGETFFRFVGVD